MEYKLLVDDCEKLIGHCWDKGINLAVGLTREENFEETSKWCTHCGLREIRKVVTTYRLEKPRD